MTGEIRGLPIWNLAWENRGIVQKNYLWEMQNGETALFWEDVWQQQPFLKNPQSSELQKHFQANGQFIVKQYSKESPQDLNCRKWIFETETKGRGDQEIVSTLQLELDKINIQIYGDQVQLWWGQWNGGDFSLREERALLESWEDEEKASQVRKVQDANLWPKIKTLLWLVMQGSILTQDNLI